LTKLRELRAEEGLREGRIVGVTKGDFDGEFSF
jgi:hypothetical protein